MKKNNNGFKIAIIVIVCLIVFALGAIFVILKTDLFKNEKQLFLGSALKIYNQENGFIENSVVEYFKAKHDTPYIDKGELYINVESQEEQEKYSKINDTRIKINGQVDTPNNRNEQNISFNYTNEIVFPFKYKKVGDLVGLQTKFVNDKSIVFDNPIKMEEIAEKISNIDKETLQATLSKIFIEDIDKTQFTKVKEMDNVGYKFEISLNQLKNIAVKLLEEIKAENTDNEEMQKNIADGIEQLEKQEIENGESKISLTLFEKDKQVIKIKLEFEGNTISIVKTKNENALEYKMEIVTEESNNTINFGVQFKGLEDLQKINENYILIINNESDKKYTIKYSSIFDFTQEVKIEEFNSDNSMVLKDYSKEEVDAFLEAVGNRLVEVNKEQMTQLGVEVNPIVSLINETASGIFISNKKISIEDIEENQNKELQETIKADVIQNKTLGVRFNYEAFSGKVINQEETKKIIMTIIAENNEGIMPKIEIVNFNGNDTKAVTENLNNIIRTLDKDKNKNYEIGVEKKANTNEIFKIVIKEK